MELGKQQSGAGATYIVRPAFVRKKEMGSVTQAVMSAGGMIPSVKVEQLAAAMIHIATEGGEEHIYENQDLVKLGSTVLAKAK